MVTQSVNDNEVKKESALDWNSEIQAETTYFALDPGVYEFDVVDIEKGYHGGSEKLPACNKAIVHLKVHYCKGKDVKVQKQLFLHSKTEGFLAAFFISIGLMEKGESLSMNWDAAIGRSGRAEFYNRESATGKSYFEVKRFLPPDDENSSTGGF